MGEYTFSHEKEVMCDGATDVVTLNHPRIYLSLQEDDQAQCPYCGKIFIYERE